MNKELQQFVKATMLTQDPNKLPVSCTDDLEEIRPLLTPEQRAEFAKGTKGLLDLAEEVLKGVDNEGIS